MRVEGESDGESVSCAASARLGESDVGFERDSSGCVGIEESRFEESALGGGVATFIWQSVELVFSSLCVD